MNIVLSCGDGALLLRVWRTVQGIGDCGILVVQKG